MITQDEIDKIQNLKARRYSQSRVAEKLAISIMGGDDWWGWGLPLHAKAIHEPFNGFLVFCWLHAADVEEFPLNCRQIFNSWKS